MQKINKSTISGTLYHTWYIYAVAAGLLTLLWLWAFMAYHQPKAHEKIEIFFSAEVTSEKFLKPIQEKYDKKVLRAVYPTYASSESLGFSQKYKIALNSADILVLTRGEVLAHNAYYDEFFAPINSYIQEKVGVEESNILDGRAILLKAQDTPHYLDNYINFGNFDYYLVFSIRSQNLGAAINEDNAQYDNALTFAKYLIEGVE